MQVNFRVEAKPQPKGSLKGFVIPGKDGRKARAILTSDNTKLKPYAASVRAGAMRAMQVLDQKMAESTIPIRLTMDFYFLKPPSVKKRKFMTVKPDIDKICRSTIDSMTGVVFSDDSQVVHLLTTKNYGVVEGVNISVSTVENDENGSLFSLEEMQPEVF